MEEAQDFIKTYTPRLSTTEQQQIYGAKGLIRRQRYCQMWLHADYLGDQRLQKALIDLLDGELPRLNQVCLAWTLVIPVGWQRCGSDQLQHWLLEKLGPILSPGVFKTFRKQLPRSYLTELLFREFKHQEDARPRNATADKCLYHVHSE